MMLMRERLEPLKNMLTGILPDQTYHYFRRVKANRYIIWAEEDEGDSFHADNRKQRQVINGTIDLFTKKEYDPTADLIQQGLEELERCSWELNSVQYEEETNLIHHEWSFRMW